MTNNQSDKVSVLERMDKDIEDFMENFSKNRKVQFFDYRHGLRTISFRVYRIIRQKKNSISIIGVKSLINILPFLKMVYSMMELPPHQCALRL